MIHAVWICVYVECISPAVRQVYVCQKLQCLVYHISPLYRRLANVIAQHQEFSIRRHQIRVFMYHTDEVRVANCKSEECHEIISGCVMCCALMSVADCVTAIFTHTDSTADSRAKLKTFIFRRAGMFIVLP